ncbi:MAG: hypothetical protein P9L99_16920 [Candidatus Lernaella stagnicola]|nr:hypothetical protein [Candidatus Lernaella stagnicola]
MLKKTLIAVTVLLAALIVAVVLWLNQERFFGRMVMPEDTLAFAEQIKQVRATQKWSDASDYEPQLRRNTLLKSQRLGCGFLYNNQKPEGNFNYEYDYVKRTQSEGDNQVRQAGALWGVALCHSFDPTSESRKALEKGLDFFFRYTRDGPDDSLCVYYPGQKTMATGTMALVSLAIIEYLRFEQELPDARRAELLEKLDGYLKFIKAMQFTAGDFSYGMTRPLKVKVGRSSPYFDGESQLALAKAIKVLGKTEYLPTLKKAVAKTAKKYTVDAWREDRQDSDLTKSFHQWGSMAFWEYQDAGWEHSDAYADTVVALGWWMIYTHHTLRRTRNTAYAYEGLVHSYRLAKSQGDTVAAADLARVIDKGLSKLTSWQVEGPLRRENSFLRKHRTDDPLAIGGIMNHRREPGLRIDVTQHQMHAVILALQHVYAE